MVASAIMIVVVAPAAPIPVAITVPAVIVLEPSAISVPIPREELLPVVARRDPACPGIWRQRPIPRMPHIAPIDDVPITVNPDIVRPRARRNNPNYARRWRRTNPNADRDLAENTPCGQ